ncbi:cytochrome c peroxidase [Flectobacillus roseus]|uniref:Cytochrome c peroxidase n=1 Tax=Flectobacillus roseus TaxID=502259 RepID=A0ABT6Y5R8_9BACT|nr:cytochrome c peroxidase [Flectobacillus roseus]MDI9858891.1 cytochrome c peroxidase [Flectobacillus roseus]
MKNKIYLTLLLLFGLMVLFSFKRVKGNEDENLFAIPSNFPKPTYHFKSNPLTTEGVELGKTLFYDAIISSDNTVSCGSCHQQSAGFTQHGHAFSHGVNDLLTKRNSMPLYNLAWSTSFGWDGGVHDLDLFAISPITNPVEMNENMANVLDKLRKSQNYPSLFKNAFGSEEINTERFLKALSQFMLTMVSANSKYDQYMRMEGVELDEKELAGLELFKQKCASCHAGELFTDYSFRNNGLEPAKVEDLGRFEVNQQESDKHKFKVPSLRNLGYTAPYMHDGRFETLEQVLDHYAGKVVKSEYLDPILQQNGKLGISLSSDEKVKIIAFLKTLDDDYFIKKESFSESSLKTVIPKKDILDDVKKLSFGNEKHQLIMNESLVFYLKLKDAILKKETNKAAVLANKLALSLDRIDRKNLDIASRVYFDKVYQGIAFDADHIIEGKALAQHQFDHFGELSANMFRLMASFKPSDKPLFYYESSEKKFSWLSNLSNEESTSIIKPYQFKDLKKRAIQP